jgi:hypothetical protein
VPRDADAALDGVRSLIGALHGLRVLSATRTAPTGSAGSLGIGHWKTGRSVRYGH